MKKILIPLAMILAALAFETGSASAHPRPCRPRGAVVIVRPAAIVVRPAPVVIPYPAVRVHRVWVAGHWTWGGLHSGYVWVPGHWRY